ncbi:MAG: prolipoprotein diacylglyceryl transferase [Thermodesulfovibrionales bacterium]|nr:prolipoprotein diacylglyceryl transferase [Thermodesulfovibrionales bacterium]
MHPELIRIGPLTIYTYGVFVAAGFLLGLGLAVRQAKKEGLPYEHIADLGFYILVGAIAGSRLFYVLLNIRHYLQNPLDALKIWEGGLVFYGGLAAALVLAAWHLRRTGLPFWRTGDIFAPSLAIGHAIGRLGCFSAGCCHGAPADVPWAVTFTDPKSLALKDIPLHPVQLYESGGEFAIFLLLIFLRKRRSFPGELLLAYGITYPVLRFIVEFFRGDEARGFIAPWLSVSQAVSAVVFIVSLSVFLRLRKQA